MNKPATPPAEVKKGRAKTPAATRAAKITKKAEPKTLTAAQRLNAIGIESICELIADGKADGVIAESLGIARKSLNDWLNLPDNIASSARAREESAESWLDRGLSAIERALPKDGGVDPSAAKAYAQECARRAAIRNPKYRDKTEIVADVTVSSLTDAQLMAKAMALGAKVGLLK